MPEWRVPGYTEMKTLGSGGFGEVMLARHDASGILVAIKYLRADLLADAEFAEMFRAEATVLASLDDPNVVRLYEYVESPSGAAIVMELVGGVSLREILRFQGKTTAEAALVVLQGSLLGLAAAHRRGVVHRDYKPENVLVNGDGISKLTDFGIAARAGDHPVPAGTLPYAAPEQMAGAAASPAGDVYAATATFYECLTGRPPFTGNDADLIRQHRFDPVPLEPLPESLRPLVATGMAKDPARRPANATTLVTELEMAAPGACGRDWRERGRSHLGEAALLLAILWPAGPPPAIQGSAVDQVRLSRGSQASRESRHVRHLRHLWHARHERPEQHLRRLGRLRTTRAAFLAGTALAVVAAGTALAATVATRPTANHPAAVVQPISLQPSPTVISSPATSPSPRKGGRSSTPPSPHSLGGALTSSPPAPRGGSHAPSSPTVIGGSVPDTSTGHGGGTPTPPATTTVHVTITASGGWVDTGLRVTSGESVEITADGSWTPDGAHYTGPEGFGDSLLSADNFFNTADLGVCGYCATHDTANWAMLISYTGDSPPGFGSYTSTAVADQATLIEGVGSDYDAPWPYSGELWLGFNDDAYSANTSDNFGQVTATVTVTPGAG